MKIYYVKNVERQDDWRFFDIELEVSEIPDDKMSEFDCSLCALCGASFLGKIRVALPYSRVREILGKMNG